MSVTVKRRTVNFVGSLENVAQRLNDLLRDTDVEAKALIVETDVEVQESRTLTREGVERRAFLTLTFEWPA